MPNTIKLKPIAAACLLATATLMAQTPYDEGQKALREQKWMDAASEFETSIESNSDLADAATYWRAYALFQAGHESEAERTLRRLEREYPESRWVHEAQALRIEHQSDGESVDALSSQEGIMDEQLRLFALSQLLDRNPERAMPLLMEMVESAESSRVRQDALFVLAVSDHPEALEKLAEVARDSSDTELQINAIHILGASSSDQTLPMLRELYSESSDTEVRRAVIDAYVSSGEPGDLVSLFESEQNPQLRRGIIHSLGAMDATDELKAIYPELEDPDLKRAAIEAFGIAGDTETLAALLDSETDRETRQALINGIAMEGDESAVTTLEQLYRDASSKQEKRDIIDAMTMVDDAGEFAMNVVRSEQDPDLRRAAIHLLGIQDHTEQLASVYDSLEDNETRKIALEAMAIAGDSDGLVRILDSESDPELRVAAINSLAIADDPAGSEFFRSHYGNASTDEKEAMIQAMMINDDAEGLLELMKSEQDPALRKQMIQTLALMDSDASEQYLFELLENDQ